MPERLTELGLFLLPFALFVALRLAARRGIPFAAVVGSTLLSLALLLAALVWFGADRALPPGARYVPAAVRAGRVVQGHAEQEVQRHADPDLQGRAGR